MVLAAWITRQLVFDGAIYGLVVGLMAMGIVLVYRTSRVLNFAVGNMGLIGAALLVLIDLNYNWPFWIAVVVAVVVGTLFGVVIELSVIRRLFTAPRVIVIVATIGVAQLALAIITAFPEIREASERYPVAIRSEWRVADVRITGPQLQMLIVTPLAALALAWFLNRTLLGKVVRASSDNPDLARLSGVNPKVVSTAMWALAGLLSTVSMILIAGVNGQSLSLATLGPSTLVRAMAAAALAGFVSVPRALVAGILVGIAQNVVQFNFLNEPGLIDFLLLVAVLVAVAVQSRQPERESSSFRFSPRVRPLPEHLAGVWWLRNIERLGFGLLVLLAAILPFTTDLGSRHLVYAVIVSWAVCALSAVILTGWAGQLSLGQMAIAGLGALTTAALTRGVTYDIGWRSHRFLRGDLPALPFGLSVLLAALAMAALAALVGVGALRVRGLLLAVSTFALAVAAENYLYQRPLFTGGESRIRLPRGSVLGLSLESRRTYYLVVLAIVVLATTTITRLRRSGVGRTAVAVRDNPDAAACATVNVARVKLRTFALAGFLAGLGGALLAATIERVPTQEIDYFLVGDSLTLVSMVVIGGLGAAIGAPLGALWVVGLRAFFPANELVPLFTTSIGLLVLLMYVPGGLLQVAYSARSVLIDWASKRFSTTSPDAPRPALSRIASADRATERAGVAGEALTTTNLTVRFGGITAVDDVSVGVGAGEIVGLIGTNGAGKSTLMNAVSGIVAASGTVQLFGRDVTGFGASTRARHGVGRTFQAATLFPELTVRETVQVALESRHRSSLLATAFALPHATRRERRSAAEADEIVDFLGLGWYARIPTSDLSTGTRRIVELAVLLALDARLLLLDEPTAGVAQRETEAFGPLIGEIRRELDASILVVEHDMPMIMSISDRIYCMEAGRIIAHGTPAEVRADPLVIASYLGTDERAIARSGTTAP